MLYSQSISGTAKRCSGSSTRWSARCSWRVRQNFPGGVGGDLVVRLRFPMRLPILRLATAAAFALLAAAASPSFATRRRS